MVVLVKVKRVVEYPEFESKTDLTAQLSSVTAVRLSFYSFPILKVIESLLLISELHILMERSWFHKAQLRR